MSFGAVLGSAIVVESILVISLGLLLLFFICKCAVVLAREKRRRKAKEIELSKLEHSSKENVSWFFILIFYIEEE